jgi:hypothetical protein
LASIRATGSRPPLAAGAVTSHVAPTRSTKTVGGADWKNELMLGGAEQRIVTTVPSEVRARSTAFTLIGVSAQISSGQRIITAQGVSDTPRIILFRILFSYLEAASLAAKFEDYAISGDRCHALATNRVALGNNPVIDQCQ